MDNKTILANRIRQLLQLDRNAAEIYVELADLSDKPALKEQLLQIAGDERRHVAISLRLLKLLGAA